MNTPTANAYTVDDIHEMRVNAAEQQSKTTPSEAMPDFKVHVENEKKTMDTLQKEKRLAMK